MNDILAFEAVSKKYGQVQALDRVSFSIRSGEVFGFIGPNGAGKTTTIKIMVGLLSDFSGTVSIDGCAAAADRRELNRVIGYMPQSVAFQEWRTVEHALVTFGRLSGLAKESLSTRIPGILAYLGLADARRRKIVHLSGGMVQKLGLAQALLHEPRLVVLDEPLSGLDPGSRIQVKAMFRALCDQGITVFFSSHILSDVQDVADRIGILSRGRMLKIGSLAELKSHFAAGEDMEIILSRDAGNWREAASVAGVAGIERLDAERLLLRLAPQADADQAIDAVIRRLLAGRNRIRSFRPLAPSLDELYLKYVQEGEAP